MKISSLLLILTMPLVGCNSLRKITGNEKKETKEEPVHNFYVIACCRDNNSGVLTYPAFVPTAHAQYCEVARTACRNADCQQNGDTYLPTDVDCDRDYKIGSEYYKGKGY